VLRNQRLQLGDELRVSPQSEICLDSVLESRQPPLLQPGRRATPESERVLELARRGLCVACGQPCASLAHELFEAVEIELTVVDPKRVAGRSSDDTVGAEGLPQL
jgi:hypothetical protein